MIKYTKHFLKKVEDLFLELDYTVRYEKGNFKSGYCIVEDKRIAVINRFFETEARINTLVEILSSVDVDVTQLEEKQSALYKELSSLASAESKGEEPSEKKTEMADEPAKERLAIEAGM